MSFTSWTSNGEILTGKLWRKELSFFNNLPFLSNIPRSDDMANSLVGAIAERDREEFTGLLLKFGKGLDDVRPFCDTSAVDVIIKDAEKILSPKLETVSVRNAGRIWGLLSKFVMLDRFSAAMGSAKVNPGISVPRNMSTREYFGTASKILDDLNPPTKILGKFLKTWEERDKTRSEYSQTPSGKVSVVGQDPVAVTMLLSRRLMAVMKAKKIIHIEAGLEMIALALAICSENGGVFPETPNDVKYLLRRIWQDRMEGQQLDEISDEIKDLHKPMKHIIEVVFATSPILAISTHGWASKMIHSTYLLRIFLALGNDRPEILLQVEDCVLRAIISLLEGGSCEAALDSLYSQILSLENDLCSNDEALNWFNLSPALISTPSRPPSESSSTHLPQPSFYKEAFQGGLASPPESRLNSPLVAIGSHSHSSAKLPPPKFVNPRDVVSPGLLEECQGPPKEKEVDDSAIPSIESKKSEESLPKVDDEDELMLDVDSNKMKDDLAEVEDEDVAVLGVDSKMSTEDLKKSLESSSELEDEGDTEMMADVAEGEEDGLAVQGVDSKLLKEDSSEAEENDEAVLVVESKKLQEISSDIEAEDDAELGVISKKSEEESSEIEDEGDTELGVKSKTLEEDSSEIEDGGDAVLGADSKTLEVDSSEFEDEDDPMKDESEKSSKDLSEDEDGGDKVNPKMSSSDLSEDEKESSAEEEGGDPMLGIESSLDSMQVEDTNPLSEKLAEPFEPRRSARHAAQRNMPTEKLFTGGKVASGKRKPAPKKFDILLEIGSNDLRPKLSDVGRASYHPTLFTEIAGWGSTVAAGARPYKHIPVQIVPPGDVESTGDDTETLRKVEACIQANFQDGLPPHLHPDANTLKYIPGSDQSRIFVASHSEFSRLQPRQIQQILRERLILVHGIPLDYSYGWDLDSFGRLHDVDKKVSVQVSSLVHPHKPDLRHHQGTLREFHQMTVDQANDEYPPLNAISLPSNLRNLFIPCQFGSLASHEVAQTRVPSEYSTTFEVPDVKSDLEWSLIGGKGAISPFHIDSDGFGTVVVVLEGSKYWVVATRVGEEENICNVDSLGPTWNPYLINDGDSIKRFRFEAVHLQKGDMLVMPGGIPHWVLGTSNAICVGRHFYSASTIRSTVISIVHTFLLGGAVTNEDHPQTRTLLYQLMVFWSMRFDKTDVDGAHIPVLSSEVEFLDIVYLGTFIILSPAFDGRFYSKKNLATLIQEAAYAIRHFESLVYNFSSRFAILIEGVPVAPSYIVDRMLAEFAAASVVFSKAIRECQGDEVDDGVSFTKFSGCIEDILQESYPRVFSYYSQCLESGHKYFTWTGPEFKIYSRADTIDSFIPSATMGKLLDLPGHFIYSASSNQNVAPACTMASIGKRRDPGEDADPIDEQPKKQRH